MTWLFLKYLLHCSGWLSYSSGWLSPTDFSETIDFAKVGGNAELG